MICAGKEAKRSTVGLAGFTLIEVMIVMAVIAILASVAYPSYQQQVVKARRAEAKAALLSTMQAQEKYYTKFNTYFAFDQTTNLSALPFRAFSSSTPATSYHSIIAEPCGSGAGQGIDACVLLTATPGDVVGGRVFDDPECESLTLKSTGEKMATGSEGAKCWQ